jgi:hypothetical protein
MRERGDEDLAARRPVERVEQELESRPDREADESLVAELELQRVFARVWSP